MPPVRLYPPINSVQINLAAPARGGWWVGERKCRPSAMPSRLGASALCSTLLATEEEEKLAALGRILPL